MFCAQCGTVNVDTANFCIKCGNALGAPPPGTVVGGATAISVSTVFAGFWKRVGAYFIDYVILMAGYFVLAIVLTLLMTKSEAAWSTAFLLFFILCPWLYAALFHSGPRQATPGKQALSIKVTDLNGQRISFGRATGRFFAEMITGMTLGIGYVMIAFTQKRQALHDVIASTLVVSANTEPSLIASSPPAKSMSGWAIAAIVVACVFPILGILAAIAIPAYQDYTVRTQVTEGLVLASDFKAAVTNYVAGTGGWPVDLTVLGFESDPQAVVGNSHYVDSIDVSNGTVTITYGRNANSQIQGEQLSLRPLIDRDGEVVWQCGNADPPDGSYANSGGSADEGTESDDGGSSLKEKYVPASCRTGFRG